MTTLRYVSHGRIEDLQVGECTIHRAADDKGRWWLMWFRVERETDGQPDDFAVPVNPNGDYSESGPAGKTWGLCRSTPGSWLVYPSINVLEHGEVYPGGHAAPSLWHQAPIVLGVPDGEPWQTSPP